MVLFDPNSHLGGRLQRRIDSWHDNPAKSQFSVYGPLNAYLQGHKFPPGKYLVKPQAKVSEEQEEAPRTDSEDSDVDMEPANKGHRAKSSWDSQGVRVKKTKRYPDFTICQYWGDDTQDDSDKIRVVIEVGSQESDEGAVQRQVEAGLDWVGPSRWEGVLLGVGIIRNKVFMMRNSSETGQFVSLYSGKWLSLFDKRFVRELDRIIEHCDNYDVDSDEE